MTRGKYSALEKLTILGEVTSGQMGFMAAARKYAIKDSDKYKIASTRQLSNWIKKYNGHSSLKAYKSSKKATGIPKKAKLSPYRQEYFLGDPKMREVLFTHVPYL